MQAAIVNPYVQAAISTMQSNGNSMWIWWRVNNMTCPVSLFIMVKLANIDFIQVKNNNMLWAYAIININLDTRILLQVSELPTLYPHVDTFSHLHFSW